MTRFSTRLLDAGRRILAERAGDPVPTTTVRRPGPASTQGTDAVQGELAGTLPPGGPTVIPTMQPGGGRPGTSPFQFPTVYGSGLVATGGIGIPTIGGGGGIPSVGDLIGWGVGQAQGYIERKLAGAAQNEPQCASGRIKVGNQCVDPGAALPGGTPLMVPAGGQAVMGVMGAPALSPTVVGEVARSNGQVGVIRRCPAGLVLGKDNLCYAKGSIPNKLRKWPKTARPPVSAYDARMMRKYGANGSKRNGVKRLAQEAGFSCKNK